MTIFYLIIKKIIINYLTNMLETLTFVLVLYSIISRGSRFIHSPLSFFIQCPHFDLMKNQLQAESRKARWSECEITIRPPSFLQCIAQTWQFLLPHANYSSPSVLFRVSSVKRAYLTCWFWSLSFRVNNNSTSN